MPSATENGSAGASNGASNGASHGIPTSCPSCPEPLKYSGSLDQYEYFELSPIIGREYPKVKVTDILHAPNSEQQIRDLAIIISERGVVLYVSRACPQVHKC